MELDDETPRPGKRQTQAQKKLQKGQLQMTGICGNRKKEFPQSLGEDEKIEK